MSDERPAVGDVWVVRDRREDKVRVVTVAEDKVLVLSRGRHYWLRLDPFVQRFRLERRRRDANEMQDLDAFAP